MVVTAAALAADLSLGVVATCGALVTCAVTMTRPVHNAVLPSLARTPGELMAGNAASTTAEGIGAFLGPLSCGLLIVFGGAQTVFAVFGLILLGAAALVVALPAGRPGRRRTRPKAGPARWNRRWKASASCVATRPQRSWSRWWRVSSSSSGPWTSW